MATSLKVPRHSCSVSRGVGQPILCGLRFFTPLKLSSNAASPTPSAPAPLLRQAAVLTQRAARSATTVLEGSLLQVAAARPALRPLGVNHVALLVKDLDRALDFYDGVLGLEMNPARPHSKLPYRGAWLWLGPEMIHLMELDNPYPPAGSPEGGGRDRHVCVGVSDIQPLVKKLDAAGVPYTLGKGGRRAVFFLDPDLNSIEVVERA